MATRPQAKGGLTAIHYWFIIFVGLWLVSTVLLVILYTDQGKLKDEKDDWEREKAKLVSQWKSIPRGWKKKVFTAVEFAHEVVPLERNLIQTVNSLLKRFYPT